MSGGKRIRSDAADDLRQQPSEAVDPRPQPPVAPEAIDCCGEGCVPCIYDHYDEVLTAYRQALADWLKRHPGAEREPSGG